MFIKGVILTFFLFDFIIADGFVYNKDALFVRKSAEFVEMTSRELFIKTGVSLYVNMVSSLDSRSYVDFKQSVVLSLKKPFVLILLVKDNKKIDIITSDDNLLDTNKVYWEYMVPLIPVRDEQITPQALSAIVLNGYIESVDLIASKFGVSIQHNVSKDERGARAISRMITYIMLFSMLIPFVIFYFKGRRIEKK